MARKGRRRAKGRAVRELGLGGRIGGGLGGGRTGGVGEGSLSREGGSWEDGRVSLALLHARCVPNVDILKIARKKAPKKVCWHIFQDFNGKGGADPGLNLASPVTRPHLRLDCTHLDLAQSVGGVFRQAWDSWNRPK